MGAILNYYRRVAESEGKTLAVDLAKSQQKRDYDIARIDRLTNSFKAPISTGDTELLVSLTVARARSRELERNNDYAKKFLKMCETNVIGRTGFTLQNKARDPGIYGKLDKTANDLLESEWKKWGKKGICTVDGRLSWLAVQKLFIRTVARDGEFLARKIRGFKNPWRFSLQILEADLLNEFYNVASVNGKNSIKMGIEYDPWDRPVAYHLRKKHPGDQFSTQSTMEYERVPADEIIHSFVPERSTQGRGIPWMRTAARRMNQVGEYEFAEVVAARLGASKMGFYEKTDPTGMGQLVPDDTDASGNPISNAEAGIFEKLPPGYKFSAFLPEHPTAQYSSFIKGSLRGVASGLGVSYNSLANDLEGVNFSSMRVGSIEERDYWKEMQQWAIDEFVTEVWETWLDMTLLTNRTTLPYSKYEKFNAPTWRGRIFDWVDPEKDINAELSCVKAKWKSDRQVVLDRFGMDLEDLYEQIAEDQKLKDKYGIKQDLGETAAKLAAKEQPEEGGQENV